MLDNHAHSLPSWTWTLLWSQTVKTEGSYGTFHSALLLFLFVDFETETIIFSLLGQKFIDNILWTWSVHNKTELINYTEDNNVFRMVLQLFSLTPSCEAVVVAPLCAIIIAGFQREGERKKNSDWLDDVDDDRQHIELLLVFPASLFTFPHHHHHYHFQTAVSLPSFSWVTKNQQEEEEELFIIPIVAASWSSSSLPACL